MRMRQQQMIALRRFTTDAAVRPSTRSSSFGSSRRFSTSTTATPPNADAGKKEGGGIPWMLILPLSFIGGVIGYFYRGNKNAKLETAFRNHLKDGQFMSPEELVQVREANKLSLPVFQELSRRAKRQFGENSQVDLKTFLDGFCVDQLGGEFQGAGKLHARHIYDRLERGFGEKVDLNTALCAVSMAVLTDPSDLIKALFPLFKDGEQMSYDRFVQVVRMFDQTNQLPVRVLVKMEKAYPFNHFSRATPEEVADKSLLALNPNPKDKEPEKFVAQRKMQSLSDEDFLNLLLSTDLCVWGACWQRAK